MSSIVALASAARTATVNSPVIDSKDFSGCDVILDVTVDPAAASITLHIEGLDPASGKWYLIGSGSAVAAVSTVVYRVGPGLTAAANSVFKFALPGKFRVRIAVADTDSMTYSVGVNLN